MRLALLVSLLAVGCAATATPASAPPKAGEHAGPVHVGEKAPPFTLTRIEGSGTIVVPSGRPMLVMLWGLAWGGDRAMRTLQEVHERWVGRGLDVVAISHDEPSEQLVRAASAYQVSYPIASDADHKVVDRYRPERVMTVYLIDRAGVIRFVRSTGKESAPTDDPTVEEAIAALLTPSR